VERAAVEEKSGGGRAGGPEAESEAVLTALPLTCAALGHRYRFTAEGVVMRWQCSRQCGAGGAKAYATAELAARYARAFDREDRDELGRRAPFLGLFPLRFAYWLRTRRNRREQRRAADVPKGLRLLTSDRDDMRPAPATTPRPS